MQHKYDMKRRSCNLQIKHYLHQQSLFMFSYDALAQSLSQPTRSIINELTNLCSVSEKLSSPGSFACGFYARQSTTHKEKKFFRQMLLIVIEPFPRTTFSLPAGHQLGKTHCPLISYTTSAYLFTSILCTSRDH